VFKECSGKWGTAHEEVRLPTLDIRKSPFRLSIPLLSKLHPHLQSRELRKPPRQMRIQTLTPQRHQRWMKNWMQTTLSSHKNGQVKMSLSRVLVPRKCDHASTDPQCTSVNPPCRTHNWPEHLGLCMTQKMTISHQMIRNTGIMVRLKPSSKHATPSIRNGMSQRGYLLIN
jgi:hypothetical protein